MKKGAIWGVVGCLLLCLAACNQGAPTTPLNTVKAGDQAKSQQEGSATGLIVTSSKGAYFVGETETLSASLKVNGQTVPVTDGTWSTDTPNVATVNQTGLVTLVGQGFVNIFCTSDGQTGSKQIWGRADCRGSWSGTYRIQRCELWKDFPDAQFCETHGGSGLPVNLVLTQEGEVLQGTVTLGGISVPFVAKPLLDGSLEMEGEFLSDPYVTNVAIGCAWTPSGPKFNMMLYYFLKGSRSSGQAMLFCDVSLGQTGAGQ